MITLYTFGCRHSNAERTFYELITMHIPVIDIRYSATSNNKRYSGEAIAARKGIVYTHIPALGNTRYIENLNGSFVEPIIEIANMDAGLDVLYQIVMKHGNAAIFCACSSVERCHRKLVAQEAHNLFGWQVVHLPARKRRKKT